MRETKPGILYELKDVSGEYRQSVEFASPEDENGTTPIEVLNVLIEKLYSEQSHAFSCETATALEFLKAARRTMVKHATKNKNPRNG